MGTSGTGYVQHCVYLAHHVGAVNFFVKEARLVSLFA